jgi:hypothetical protein
MESITLAIAVTVGLTEVVKRTRLFNARYIPAIALLIGIAMSALINHSITPDVVFSGIIVGLSSCGLYAGSKKTIKG